MSDFTLIDSYRDNAALRESFYAMIATVFTRVNFAVWHDQGWWPDHYRPFSLLHYDQMVANVSVCEMTVLIDARPTPAIQIGAVATHPDYRGRGLSRRLMDHVMARYRDIPFAFLFANDSVLDFYPKFGFRPQKEMIFRTTRDIPPPAPNLRKLNVADPADRELIRTRLASRTEPTSLFGARDFDFITAWHLINVYPEGVFYSEPLDVIWVISIEGRELHIADVIWQGELDIHSALPAVIPARGIDSITWCLTPDRLSFPHDQITELDDSGLFIRGDFPIADREFKFPATAQT